MPKLKQHSVVQKSYQCEFCKVKCRRPQDLRRHLFVHSEASFQCEGCGNKFTRYDTLMRHKRDNCRNAHITWTERRRLERDQAMLPQYGEKSPINTHHRKATPREAKLGSPPVFTLNVPPYEGIESGEESPVAFTRYNYYPHAIYSSVPSVISPVQGPALACSPQPIIPYPFQTFRSPQYTLGDTAQNTVPVAQPIPGSEIPHSPAFTSTQVSFASPQPPSVSSHNIEDSGAGTRELLQSHTSVKTNSDESFQMRQLPKLLDQSPIEPKVQRDKSLQPLEPRPLQFPK